MNGPPTGPHKPWALGRYPSGRMVLQLWYPRTDEAQRHVEVELIDTRANDGLRLSFDFDRDGWAIEQPLGGAEDEEGETIWVEVFFARGWGLEPCPFPAAMQPTVLVQGPGEQVHPWKIKGRWCMRCHQRISFDWLISDKVWKQAAPLIANHKGLATDPVRHQATLYWTKYRDGGSCSGYQPAPAPSVPRRTPC